MAYEVVHRYKPGEDVPVKAESEKLPAGRAIAIPVAKSEEGDYLGKLAAEKALNFFGFTDRETADPKASPAPEAHAWTLRTNVTRPGAIVRAEVEDKAEVKEGDEVMIGKEGCVKKAAKAEEAIGVALTTGTGDAKSPVYVEVVTY